MLNTFSLQHISSHGLRCQSCGATAAFLRFWRSQSRVRTNLKSAGGPWRSTIRCRTTETLLKAHLPVSDISAWAAASFARRARASLAAMRPNSERGASERASGRQRGPISLTKTIPAKIRRLKISGRSHPDLGIPPLRIKILLEPDPKTQNQDRRRP